MAIPSIKNEVQYEVLGVKGYGKQKAARIANTRVTGKKGGKAKPYEKCTKYGLYKQAKNVGIVGSYNMDKAELIHALINN